MAKLKLTDEVLEKICNAIRLGATYKDAAIGVGVGETTFYRWMRRGEKAKSGVYRKFWQAIQRANREAQLFHLQNINKAARGGAKTTRTTIKIVGDKEIERSIVEETRPPDWRASVYILNSRFPELYNPNRIMREDHNQKRLQPLPWTDDINELEFDEDDD